MGRRPGAGASSGRRAAKGDDGTIRVLVAVPDIDTRVRLEEELVREELLVTVCRTAPEALAHLRGGGPYQAAVLGEALPASAVLEEQQALGKTKVFLLGGAPHPGYEVLDRDVEGHALAARLKR